MARLPAVRREDLPREEQQHYDFIADNRPELSGPFPLLLNSPDVAARIANVGTYIRFQTTLEPPVRELTILAVARAWDCPYEWSAHQPIAEEVGVRPEAIAAIRDRTAPGGLTDREALVFAYADSLIKRRRLPDETFDKALEWLGRRGVTDLTATVGYYSMLACVLGAFEVTPHMPLLPAAGY